MRKFRQNGFWLRVFCVFLVFITGFSNQLQADDPNEIQMETETAGISPTEKSTTDIIIYSFWEDIQTLPDVVIENSKEIAAKPDNALLLLLAGAGSVVMHNGEADKDLANNFEDNNFLSNGADKALDLLGGPGFHFAATGLWYALSVRDGDEFSKQRSWTMMKALSVTGSLTLGLKFLRNNKTPNGKALAWPSGHTSSSFTVAAVLDEFYGPKVGIPAYIGAGFVGYRMMEVGDHWGSDVVFGAVLGYIVGHHVAGKDKQLQIGGFDVVPLTATAKKRPFTGIGLFKRF